MADRSPSGSEAHTQRPGFLLASGQRLLSPQGIVHPAESALSHLWKERPFLQSVIGMQDGLSLSMPAAREKRALSLR